MAEAKKNKQTKAITKSKSEKPKLSSLLDLKLTPEIVHNFLNRFATPEEIKVFIYECQAFGLNPFKREIYLIKYSPKDPAKSVVGYEVYLKRADRSKNWDGFEFGTEGKRKNMTAWCRVFRKDWSRPLFHEVAFEEYVQYKADGTNYTRFWKEKPQTMLKKVVVAQTLRMAFPDEFAGMPYIVEEVRDVDMQRLPDALDRCFDESEIQDHFEEGEAKDQIETPKHPEPDRPEPLRPETARPESNRPTPPPSQDKEKEEDVGPIMAEIAESPELPEEEIKEGLPEDNEAPQSKKMDVNRLIATLCDNYNKKPDTILERMDEKIGHHNINELTGKQADIIIKHFKWVIGELEKKRVEKQAQA